MQLLWSNCSTDIDIDVEINTNIYASLKADVALNVEICQELQSTSPDPEDPKDSESGLLGKWDDCESHDQCETGLCFCYICVDLTDFITN